MNVPCLMETVLITAPILKEVLSVHAELGLCWKETEGAVRTSMSAQMEHCVNISVSIFLEITIANVIVAMSLMWMDHLVLVRLKEMK